MSLAIIVGLPLLAGFGLLYWADQVKEDAPILALVFQLMFLPCIFLSITFAVQYLTLVYGAYSDMVITLSEFAYYFGWLFFIVGLYLLYVLVKKIVAWFTEKKKAREEKLYG